MYRISFVVVGRKLKAEARWNKQISVMLLTRQGQQGEEMQRPCSLLVIQAHRDVPFHRHANRAVMQRQWRSSALGFCFALPGVCSWKNHNWHQMLLCMQWVSWRSSFVVSLWCDCYSSSQKAGTGGFLGSLKALQKVFRDVGPWSQVFVDKAQMYLKHLPEIRQVLYVAACCCLTIVLRFLENHQLPQTAYISVVELVRMQGREAAELEQIFQRYNQKQLRASSWGVKLVYLGTSSTLLTFPLSVILLLKGPSVPHGVKKPGAEAGDFTLSPVPCMAGEAADCQASGGQCGRQCQHRAVSSSSAPMCSVAPAAGQPGDKSAAVRAIHRYETCETCLFFLLGIK